MYGVCVKVWLIIVEVGEILQVRQRCQLGVVIKAATKTIALAVVNTAAVAGPRTQAARHLHHPRDFADLSAGFKALK